MIRYKYVKIKKQKHPVTISYEVISNKDSDILVMLAGVAICNSKDTFTKDFGRNLADKRRLEKPHYVMFKTDLQVSIGKRAVDAIEIWAKSEWRNIIKDP